MLSYEQMNQANIARLQQLAADADAKKAEFFNLGGAENERSAAHYAGMRDGLLRAVGVLEGRG